MEKDRRFGGRAGNERLGWRPAQATNLAARSGTYAGSRQYAYYGWVRVSAVVKGGVVQADHDGHPGSGIAGSRAGRPLFYA